MTPDPLQERVARALLESEGLGAWVDCGPNAKAWALRKAAAVLADLREAGELREYEQVGFLAVDKGMFVTATGPLRGTDPPEGWVPVYIVREDNPPKVCPTCGSDDPKVRLPVVVKVDRIVGRKRVPAWVTIHCSDPFHSQGEPCDLCGGGFASIEDAIAFLHEHTTAVDPTIEWDYDDRDAVTRAYRAAAKRLHPDAGGTPEDFQRLDEAYRMLVGPS